MTTTKINAEIEVETGLSESAIESMFRDRYADDLKSVSVDTTDPQVDTVAIELHRETGLTQMAIKSMFRREYNEDLNSIAVSKEQVA